MRCRTSSRMIGVSCSNRPPGVGTRFRDPEYCGTATRHAPGPLSHQWSPRIRRHGILYRAEDIRLGRTVAIKFLRMTAAPATLRLRFQREAQAISSLNHPHICALYDIGTFGDASYLVLEHVEGETLAHALKDGPFTVDKAISIGAQVAEGLAVAHAKGIVHRDLKPGNVMVTEAGAKYPGLWLVQNCRRPDLRIGAPTLTIDGAVMGTPAYMSPEQFTNSNVDARSDIFSLGVVLYEMATGRRPFSAGSAPQIMNAWSNLRARRLSPLVFDHINLLGRYAFSVPDSVAQGQLRPLRNPTDALEDFGAREK